VTSDDHVLVGAYVLHALTDDERASFLAHLRACRPCRQDAAELSGVLTRLAQAVSRQPPPRLRDRVLTTVAHTRQHRRFLDRFRSHAQDQ
jgi:hypothetical protein